MPSYFTTRYKLILNDFPSWDIQNSEILIFLKWWMLNFCLLYWTKSHVCHALGVIKFCSLELTMTIMTFSNLTPVQVARACARAALSHKSSRSRVCSPPNVTKYNTALTRCTTLFYILYRIIMLWGNISVFTALNPRSEVLVIKFYSTKKINTILYWDLEVFRRACMYITLKFPEAYFRV